MRIKTGPFPVKQMRRKLKCFFDEIAGRGYTTMDAGLRVVEVDKILGTVGKCGELDGRFRSLRRRDRLERYRRSRTAQAFANPAVTSSIPPIDLYRFQRAYYVVDGHRRVAAALAAGLEFMDAQVTEVVRLDDHKVQEGFVSRRRFESETGLKNIRLAYEPGYRVLLDEIRCYGAWGDLKEKAEAWQSEVYLPACRKIEEAELSELLTGMKPPDIFVMILRFHREFDSGFGGRPGFDTILERFLGMRGSTQCRLIRRKLLRFLRSLFSRLFSGS